MAVSAYCIINTGSLARYCRPMGTDDTRTGGAAERAWSCLRFGVRAWREDRVPSLRAWREDRVPSLRAWRENRVPSLRAWPKRCNRA